MPRLNASFFVASTVLLGSMLACGESNAIRKADAAAASTQPARAPVPAAALAPAPARAPAPAPAKNTAAAASARTAVAKMVSLGLIKRMDVKTGKFYIDGELWEGFELDAQENIVKVISGYREAEYKGLPLYESRSGKELANYGAFSGVTIK
jgi:hypothetical protein